MTQPSNTAKNNETLKKWQAFRRYLQNIEKYEALEEVTAIWDQYLPYAVAFGVEQNYIKKFADIEAPIPAWYQPLIHTMKTKHANHSLTFMVCKTSDALIIPVDLKSIHPEG